MSETKKDIIIPSTDDIIAINQKLGGTVLNKGMIDFIIAKIEAKVPKKDYKRQIATIAAIFWFEIIQGHPFVDGNKRTATETMKLFLKKNGFRISYEKLGSPIKRGGYMHPPLSIFLIVYPALDRILIISCSVILIGEEVRSNLTDFDFVFPFS
jgi:death-on-curing family protein